MSFARKLVLLALPVAALAVAGACTSSPSSTGPGGAPAARTVPPDTTLPTPTPRPIPMSRTNPNIIEETETYYIERLPKAEYVKVDDRHIRHPLISGQVEIYREDEAYYYVYNKKFVSELDAKPTPVPGVPTPVPALRRGETPRSPRAPTAEDFENLAPARVAGRARLERVASSGLPASGLWRASFVLADMNGDGRLDIVAPPSRIGAEPSIHVFLGDGTGKFQRWKLSFTSEEGLADAASVGYGGVAAGDIDGDGKMDVVSASHGAGLASFFGDGKGGFRVVRRGLPGAEFSSQSIVLLDADGDKKLDIAASRDVVETKEDAPVDTKQVRIYFYRGRDGWQYAPAALDGGFYSNSLHAWDGDADGRTDLLTGSHYSGALTLLWRNRGGAFESLSFPDIEVYAYHFATAPGTFGTARRPAFADAYYMYDPTTTPARKATGITLYERTPEGWARHRVWRAKDGGSQQYGLAFGDVDGDGLDDVLFPDSERNRLRVLFQGADGAFLEMSEAEEPALDSVGQCVRMGDLDGDGRLDVVLSKTVVSFRPDDQGGWDVYLNRPARP